ncbi:MAG TPA: CsbD family protein [Micromonosporaceae bacterium]|nr:CsbD family protein [Micromonosporaceae bacterium]
MSTGDDIRNKTEELKGEAKEKVGDWTDNESLQAEGLVDQAKAKAKQAAEDAKDKAHEVREEVRDRMDR